MSTHEYQSLYPADAPVTEIILLDTVLDKFGRIDFADLHASIQSVSPYRMVYTDRTDRLSPYTFYAVAVDPDFAGYEIFAPASPIQENNLGEMTVDSSVVYSGIGLVRNGWTNFHEIRIYLGHPAIDPSLEAIFNITITISTPDTGVLTTASQQLAAGQEYVAFPVSISAPHIDLEISVDGATAIKGIEILAEPAGRR